MFQANSNEVELGCQHTIKSHGGRVARNHKHDWLILILLVVIDIILNIIHPFYRFVGQDMMTDLKYPMKDNTVPIWAVPLYAVLLPIAIFVLYYLRRKDVYDLHHSILGWGTYAYFRALEEVRPNPGPVPPRNGISMQGMNHQSSAVPVNSNVVDQDLDTSFDAMESGRR
ncbi:UNVERIFIED_CONTAM: Lipid phosphate phosphatase 1 [Sesamum calycinum]|uniref:Lipid phosphate phosphatase 1 n=1 Tax=Sesamum calycinum TaxID=2727403 RepID=A0AAW2QZ93_9LAMI